MKLFILSLIILGLSLPTPKCDAMRLKSDSGKYNVDTERVAHLLGSYNNELASRFEIEMIETIRKGDRLIIIDSGGGIVEAGDRIINIIEAERKQGVRVICFVLHAAHSMAFNTLSHCDVRLASPKAYMVVHKVAQELPQDSRYTAKVLRQAADGLDKTDEPYRQLNARLMHMSLSDYDLFADNETAWASVTLLTKKYLQDLAEISP